MPFGTYMYAPPPPPHPTSPNKAAQVADRGRSSSLWPSSLVATHNENLSEIYFLPVFPSSPSPPSDTEHKAVQLVQFTNKDRTQELTVLPT
jgi:hypothetical protein